MPEPIVTSSKESLKTDLRELVRRIVEATLNGLLEEAGALAGSERFGRAAGREAYHAGHYERKLVTTSGEVRSACPSSRAYGSPPRSSSATAGARRATGRR
ncbi:transposase [Candidatus Collinsella stercoripullorum]|uniref:transposase n=1 Tax=Candidatus Collinsella stercoripullorum TaxID=2838522 RepID=UPI0022E143AE|nr:hypothetical protein [Candidatus Collinsella stercoripullorum]